MAVTAETGGALPLDPPPWTAPPTTTWHRRSRSWAIAGSVGAVLMVTAAMVLTFSRGAASGDVPGGSAGGTASTDVHALARRYTALVTSYQSAAGAWQARAERLTAGSAASAEAFIRPTVQFADAVDRADHDVARLPWPASLRGNVSALEADLATVSGDLRSIGAQSVASMTQWVANVVDDLSQSTGTGDRLARDLGTWRAPA